MAVNSKYLRIAGEQHRIEFIQFTPMWNKSHTARRSNQFGGRNRDVCTNATLGESQMVVGRQREDECGIDRWLYGPLVCQIQRWENSEGAPSECLLHVEIVLNRESMGLLRAG
ncbi:hypothetical protein DFH08DRAFT_797973 [Mycena albidolilacea]|uniref:Uncharacterized protein n=1 Tax=Mycena albidolilacea TaxID=1033008 RepID=A0AAD7ASM9_9AGAR|nr:hypothetical protein DFH08DRAFT_797973 [Mycena albidolilacea]